MLSPFHFRIVYNLLDQLLFNHSFAIWGKSSLEMPLADVQKFGSGVQIQIACSAMSVVARYESISISVMQLCSSICFISTMVACGAACHVRQLSHCGQILIPFLLRLGKEADATAAKLCHWPGISGRKKINLEQGRPTETATYIHDNPVRVSVGQKMKKHTFPPILSHLTHINKRCITYKTSKNTISIFLPQL